ncbi:helix-turn-helix domain-containing protein [Tellurirhabdus rosea]|uniref:helix-turn-helix domain-containing protein n=1 Tax=Tellurirhabdus rosea TaxID=2674997 RepID=UPI0022588A66|nr:helix-turn-helix transcriptional regulator [Tellurirhabdus rosea]
MPSLPLRIDLFALIMLLGVAQGLFLGIFFLSGQRGRVIANRCIGWAMLAQAAIVAEIFLDYTNYTFRVLWLVDFAEPFNFLPGPLLFLFVYSRIHREPPRFWYLHLIPFGIWVLNSISWHHQPLTYKYNSYIESIHPEMPFLPWKMYHDTDFTGLRDYINEMTLLSCLLYSVGSLWVIAQAVRHEGRPLLGALPHRLAQLRNLTLFFVLFPVLIVVVKPQFKEDLGDYLLACYITFTIYATTLLVMSGSDFFRDEAPTPVPAGSEETPPGALRPKYGKSALPDELEEALLTRLNQLFEEERPYLEADLSLPKLAQRLNTTPHHLSQLLNDRLNQSFFDLLATYRVRVAQELLQNPATAGLKIDEIAGRVGYNSTSAFHTAFKRLTGQTPAQFRDSPASPPSARTSS